MSLRILCDSEWIGNDMRTKIHLLWQHVGIVRIRYFSEDSKVPLKCGILTVFDCQVIDSEGDRREAPSLFLSDSFSMSKSTQIIAAMTYSLVSVDDVRFLKLMENQARPLQATFVAGSLEDSPSAAAFLPTSLSPIPVALPSEIVGQYHSNRPRMFCRPNSRGTRRHRFRPLSSTTGRRT
jgi:hypothetical protein